MLSDSELEQLASIERGIRRDDPDFVESFRTPRAVRPASSNAHSLTAATLIISVMLTVPLLFLGLPVLSVVCAMTAWCAAAKLSRPRAER